MKERIQTIVIKEETKNLFLKCEIFGIPFLIATGIILEYFPNVHYIAYPYGITGSLIVAYGIAVIIRNVFECLFPNGIGWKTQGD